MSLVFRLAEICNFPFHDQEDKLEREDTFYCLLALPREEVLIRKDHDTRAIIYVIQCHKLPHVSYDLYKVAFVRCELPTGNLSFL